MLSKTVGYIAQNCGAVMARPTSDPADARNPLNTCLFATNLHRNPRNRNAKGPAISCGHGPFLNARPWLDRMDRFFDLRGIYGSELRMRPSQLFRRNCWIASEPAETSLTALADYIGPDRILW